MRRERLLLFIIVIIGTVLRIMKFGDSTLVMDSVVYSRLGKNLIESGRYAFGENYNMGVFFPPGYPVFIGMLDLLLNDLFLSARLVSLIAGIITIVVVYLIGKELYDKESGLFSAFIYAFYPLTILISIDAYSDSLYLLFVFLTIYIFIIFKKKNNISTAIQLGVVTALAYLTRSEGLFYLLLPLLAITGFFNDKESGSKRRYIINFLVVSLLFSICSLPYLLFLKDYTGKFTISGKSNISILLGELSGEHEYHKIVNAPDNLYDRAAFALDEDKRELKGWNKKKNLSLKEYLFKNPSRMMERYIRNLLQEVRLLTKLLIPILIPLCLSFFDKDLLKRRLVIVLMGFSLFFLLLYPLFITIEKQTLLAVIVLIFQASYGIKTSGSVVYNIARYYGVENNRISDLLSKNIKLIIMVILIMSSLLYIRYSRFQHFDLSHAMPKEHEMAGYFLKERFHPAYEELNIMGKEPFVSFYSNSRFTMLPYAPLDDVINFAHLYDVDFIVVDERSLRMWDYYDELLNMADLRDDVELVYETEMDGMSIRLFMVKRSAG